MVEIRKKIGKPYFENLEFKDFDEYCCVVWKPNLNSAIEQDPPVWFCTIDEGKEDIYERSTETKPEGEIIKV